MRRIPIVCFVQLVAPEQHERVSFRAPQKAGVSNERLESFAWLVGRLAHRDRARKKAGSQVAVGGDSPKDTAENRAVQVSPLTELTELKRRSTRHVLQPERDAVNELAVRDRTPLGRALGDAALNLVIRLRISVV